MTGQHAAIIHTVGEGGKIQSLDEIGVGEERPLEAKSGADGGVLFPSGAGGTMPENLDDIACPPLASQHTVEELLGLANAREDANEDFAGQGSNGGETFRVGDLHVLKVGDDAERGLGVVVYEEEVGLFVVGGGGRVCRRRRPRVSRLLGCSDDRDEELIGIPSSSNSGGGGCGCGRGVGVGTGTSSRRAGCDDIERRSRRSRHAIRSDQTTLPIFLT
ncbi:hypothetical protein RRF57_008563 [Xylaria bambusicola]|uniref:Uncharacterized protein n=1 Tax=Xylaria bambusicola TaxID=326684 RepID=A0AAN7UI22_9PEZI